MSGTDDIAADGLYIEADLTVGLEDTTLEVRSVDGVLYVEARSFGPLGELRALADGDMGELFRKLGVEVPLKVGTPVVIRVRGVRVGSYQPGEPAGRLAGLAGTAPFRPAIGGVLRAAVRRFRPMR